MSANPESKPARTGLWFGVFWVVLIAILASQSVHDRLARELQQRVVQWEHDFTETDPELSGLMSARHQLEELETLARIAAWFDKNPKVAGAQKWVIDLWQGASRLRDLLLIWHGDRYGTPTVATHLMVDVRALQAIESSYSQETLHRHLALRQSMLPVCEKFGDLPGCNDVRNEAIPGWLWKQFAAHPDGSRGALRIAPGEEVVYQPRHGEKVSLCNESPLHVVSFAATVSGEGLLLESPRLSDAATVVWRADTKLSPGQCSTVVLETFAEGVYEIVAGSTLASGEASIMRDITDRLPKRVGGQAADTLVCIPAKPGGTRLDGSGKDCPTEKFVVADAPPVDRRADGSFGLTFRVPWASNPTSERNYWAALRNSIDRSLSTQWHPPVALLPVFLDPADNPLERGVFVRDAGYFEGPSGEPIGSTDLAGSSIVKLNGKLLFSARDLDAAVSEHVRAWGVDSPMTVHYLTREGQEKWIHSWPLLNPDEFAPIGRYEATLHGFIDSAMLGRADLLCGLRPNPSLCARDMHLRRWLLMSERPGQWTVGSLASALVPSPTMRLLGIDRRIRSASGLARALVASAESYAASQATSRLSWAAAAANARADAGFAFVTSLVMEPRPARMIQRLARH